ncbi:Adck5 [Symbiodinium necroappetens]|uniref:Adck5 protein n=1 Tax=Symbiodinium necroappetens TaxID=1628268 RepID=A0A812ZLL4_9DINO|nr:Adck5 [Symbiodinium necroappetens]
MRGPPGTFLREWQGKGFGQGTPGLPPGPCAYATGRVDQAGARPGAGTAPMSPNAPSTTSTPLLGTSPPTFTAQSSANVDIGAASSGSQAAGAARPSVAGSMANALGAAGVPGGAGTGEDPQGVQSAFELLGRKPPTTQGQLGMETSDAIVKALTMAVSGERKFIPSWGGGASTLRAWLKQLSFWELDNHVPKNRWGVKLFQALPQNSIPRRIAEGLPMEVITSERGYGAILTAILEKFKPYLEAAAPAAVDAFFFQGDRGRNETFPSFIAAKELARQEVENLSGERVPDKIAGRILLKQANLTESQRENMAIKHNALLSFEDVARALRPLDRPDALLKPMASSSLLMKDRRTSQYYVEEEFDEPSEPLLYFEADREFDEEEALYIWAYNDAYQQLSQEFGAHDPTSFPAYQDVRRELQARRKGRQFFCPREQKGASKGKGRGKSPWSSKGSSKGRGKKGGAGKGKGRGNRGTAEELLARTRCYGCGELGHFSRDCPNATANAAENRASFVVSQGQGALNRTFMTAGTFALPATVSVFAGVRTQAGQGLVDSAGAFSRLRALLEQQGLRPVAVRGPTGSCAGIGGSATVASVWDVPIGVARTNGLLRVTEVKDAEGFETPFLIPVSFQELVGMVIDYDKEEVRTRQGHTTPMMRLPSGHRAVSVVEFNGSWRLPKELQQSGKAAWSGDVQHFGVTYNISDTLDDASAVYDFEGVFSSVSGGESVQQSVVLQADERVQPAVSQFAPSKSSSGDAWQSVRTRSRDMFARIQASMKQEVPRRSVHFMTWARDRMKPSSMFAGFVSLCLLSSSYASTGARACPRRAGNSAGPRQPSSRSCMVPSNLAEAGGHHCQDDCDEMVLDAILTEPPSSTAASSSGPPPKARTSKRQQPVRQGLGRPFSRSQTQGKFPKEPEDCSHHHEQLRMRGNQAMHWWVCLDCGGRWERTEAIMVAGQGALPDQVRPVYRATDPPQLLPFRRSRSNLGMITLEQATAAPPKANHPKAAPGVRFSPGSRATTAGPANYRKEAIRQKFKAQVSNATVDYPDQMFSHEPEYQMEGPGRAPAGQSSSMEALRVYDPSAPVKDLDRVDTRQLTSRAPNEWADYHEQSLRSKGPTGTSSTATATNETRSRSLPAGVHPIQNRARRRQVHEPQEAPELFAIFDDQEPATVTSSTTSTTSTTIFTMLTDAPPEAGIVQGESGAFSFQFVLFRVPNQKHSDFYLGNFFCRIVYYALGVAIHDQHSGSSWDTFVSVAKIQEDAGRLYALVCVPKAVSGLQNQLKDTTAVEMSLVDKGPRLYVLVNDQTLARICSSVSWKGSSWATSDSEDLDLCVRTFLQSLCYARTLDNMPHPSTADVAQAANKHRPAFDGLLSAVRAQTAFLASTTVAFPSFGEDEVMELEPTVAPEDDEVFREVQHALQPSRQQVVEAMKKVDDFRNLNHPAKEVFIRAMKHSGARADVIQWIKEAGASREGYLQVIQCADARAITVRQALSRAWIAPFGVPEVLICDQGPEFAGEQFVEFMSQMGAAIHYTDGSTPWKNGRAERAVGTVKNKLKVVLQETSATAEELDLVVAQVVSAHNSLYDRHGFSPDQRLFGLSLRLPGSLLADDRWDQDMVKASAGDLVQRSWAIREAARAAWIKEDDVVSVRRASAAQTRKSELHAFSFYPGQWAYVWRRNDNRHGWVGPGALIAVTPGGNSWWINMRGRLWKVATLEEELGAALALELHKDLLQQVREGVRAGYEDVTVEGPPDRFVEEIFPEVFGEDVPEELEEGDGRPLSGTATLRLLLPPDGINYLFQLLRRPLRHHCHSSQLQNVIYYLQWSRCPPDAGAGQRRAIQVDEGSHEPLLLGPSRERHGPYTRSPYYYSKLMDLEEKIKPSTYLSVTDFEDNGAYDKQNFMAYAGPKWVNQNTSGRTQLEPLKPKETFHAEESEASYCPRDKCLYLAKAKVSFGQVEYSKLVGKAVRVLTVEESEKFMREHPDHVLKSRFVDRSRRLLVMEFIDGCKIINAPTFFDDWDYARDVPALHAALETWHAMQLFLTGCFHGDPHPGNVLVRRRADAVPAGQYLVQAGVGIQMATIHTAAYELLPCGLRQVVVIDHGGYYTLDDDTRKKYAEVWSMMDEPKNDAQKTARRARLKAIMDGWGVGHTSRFVIEQMFNGSFGAADPTASITENGEARRHRWNWMHQKTDDLGPPIFEDTAKMPPALMKAFGVGNFTRNAWTVLSKGRKELRGWDFCKVRVAIMIDWARKCPGTHRAP